MVDLSKHVLCLEGVLIKFYGFHLKDYWPKTQKYLFTKLAVKLLYGWLFVGKTFLNLRLSFKGSLPVILDVSEPSFPPDILIPHLCSVACIARM